MPAAIGQRLLWMLGHYRGRHLLTCPLLVRVHGPLAQATVTEAINILVGRHEALRTTLHRNGRHLHQRIHAMLAPDVDVADLDGSPASAELLAANIAAELAAPLDMATSPLRVRWWRVTPNEHVLCLNMHHLVSDAWSSAILFDELTKLVVGGRGATDSFESRWQYADFVAWQDQLAANGVLERHRRYWEPQLAGIEPLPLGRESGTSGHRTGVAVASIDRHTVDALEQRARAAKTTLFTMLLTAFGLLIHHETGREDITVASLFANRMKPELRGTVGFIANPVLLRTAVGATVPFAELLLRTHRVVVDAFVHQEYPIYLLPSALLQRGTRRVDDVVFQMMPMAMRTVDHGALRVEPFPPESLGSRFELELTTVERREGVQCLLFYNEERFDRAWATRFLQDFGAVARAVAAHKEPTTCLTRHLM